MFCIPRKYSGTFPRKYSGIFPGKCFVFLGNIPEYFLRKGNITEDFLGNIAEDFLGNTFVFLGNVLFS
jgi:hypothetical protein